MTAGPFVLAIDQGTTSTRAIVFDDAGRPCAVAQRELEQHYPGEGLVEHDPEEIWRATRDVVREAAAAAGGRVTAIGITNQRETSVIWDRATGTPIHRAIVWQDRRTAGACEALRTAGHEPLVQRKTGLLLDPYFSATKVRWLLDHVAGTRAAAERGALAFGTIDTFLLWRLTGGAVHATDATNASRTLLYDIHRGEWDDELCALFGVPRALLPRVMDSAADFGHTTPDLCGEPIALGGVAGDQQAAALGQACVAPATIKATYGTGCFVLLHTGDRAVPSHNRLLTTIASRIDGRTSYALEGSIFAAGSTVQWLRDGLGMIAHASETEALARTANPRSRVVLVPAFTGLGAPYWDAHARAAMFGITRDTGRAEIARAALESVAFQTRDLLDAMAADGAQTPQALRVDGGLTANAWAMQFLADVLGIAVERPRVTETTALGAAFLAGLTAGVWRDLDALCEYWQLDARFEPAMAASERDARYGEWRAAVARVLG